MVRKDNPNKQEWEDFKTFHFWKSVANSEKFRFLCYSLDGHMSVLTKDKVGKIFFSMTEKEQREVYRRLSEKIHSINESINGPAGEIRKELESRILEIQAEVNEVMKHTLINAELLRVRNRTENLISKISFWIPRKYREGVVGDILEDCHELRVLGKSKWRIRIHIIWQILIALIMLRPTALMDAFKRIWSTK